ncbi:hypothetical protein [Mycobacterium sp. 852002-30065_SCH5024008]|uniref:hypothetical protein n=1 Tax=Mycobacterium sp. 852002-30065_SCH5024008 TaxID=1834088 RepID=UPI0008012D77|nr:hypothetical protein [Mycobacterium sp. 852002-30065_SCH5024008]OBB86057.1 hypothetical protein A5781_06100 [Mycobacterium sp. 852002-30065_SCH5024008]
MSINTAGKVCTLDDSTVDSIVVGADGVNVQVDLDLWDGGQARLVLAYRLARQLAQEVGRESVAIERSQFPDTGREA